MRRQLPDVPAPPAPGPIVGLPAMDPAALQKMQTDALTKYRGLLLVLAIGYAIIASLSLALIVYLRRNRTVAFRGDSNAARKVILPAYVPLLLMLMLMAFVYSVFFCVLRALTTDVMQAAGALESEAYYSMRLFFMLIVVVYMYQKSVTTPALRRATLLTLLLSTYTLPIVWLVETYAHSSAVKYWVPQLARVFIVVLCLYVLVVPPERASKRSIREYILFVMVYYVLFFTYSELFYQVRLDEGFLVAYANILWGALCPLVIWRVLKADTEHWRGLGRRAVALQSLFRQKHRMDERISSRGLHVLIEMHRKYIIDFAVLELKHKIGTGSSAIVFNGVLHSKTPVAIKVYSPSELTDEVVAEFSHEAALCGALHHPNIVKFYGMCVCPPTVCLVSELCQGALDDVTKALARRPHDATRQQLMINLNYMIDATRAVAYLHSFSPAFLHRDIKPGNFLVDRRCVVKLTDFGESRSLPRECTGHRHGGGSLLQSSQPAGDTAAMLGGRASMDGWVGLGPGTESMHTSAIRRPAMTVRGTAEYMAPELIQGKAGTALYGEAADIFSLAMTLWDILYPLDDKYPRANGNHLKVFEAVLAGQRPGFRDAPNAELCELLARAWDPRPEKRPSALCLLTSLERIHAQVSGEVAVLLANAMEKKIMITRKGCTTEHTCAGQDLVQKMLEFDVVDSVDEGVRAGNGLLSAGLLHHARHVLGFECSAEQYMFDEPRMDALLYGAATSTTPRMHPVVEQFSSGRRRRSSSAFAGVPVPESRPILDEDYATTVGDDDESSACYYGDADEGDGDSEFGRSVGPQISTTAAATKPKSDESREGETASVAAAIGNTVSELLRFGPRRKLSRTGTQEDSPPQPPSQAVTTPWTNTTTGDANACPCKRLGAGLMYISKRGHGAHGAGPHGSTGATTAGSAINKRFRRNKRAASGNGSFLPGDSQGGDRHHYHHHGTHPHHPSDELFITPPDGVGGAATARASTQSAVENGLTARLLMNDFTHTGGSDAYDSPALTPLSSSDVEMGFHVADTSDEDEDDEDEAARRHRELRRRLGLRPAPRRVSTRRADGGRADSNGSSTQDGSSSLESSTVVHPVDMA